MRVFLKAMNALEIYLAVMEIDHNTAMNKLTEQGLISDLAVVAADVALRDAERARDFLAEQAE